MTERNTCEWVLATSETVDPWPNECL